MIEQKIGRKTASSTFTVELGKVKEFALALGDSHPDYQTGDAIPPTFATVIDFWSGDSSMASLLKLNMEKVLHGGQEFEYLGVPSAKRGFTTLRSFEAQKSRFSPR
ncbi:MaoC family dehydratase N-terminal domain-containing protein, partial [Brevibacillus sp. AY1]|uniref:FAS1-like dehydratase domain-containing protein n=1 Tax=Brevibacillus sp. AY1 TaxID=2807621 RepID=UPI00245542B3